MSKHFNRRPRYSMVREEEGMAISLFYSNDGYWRVSNDGKDMVQANAGFAQTEKANLTRPYGRNCKWKLKFNLIGERGMQPAPTLISIALDQGETIFRKVSSKPINQ